MASVKQSAIQVEAMPAWRPGDRLWLPRAEDPRRLPIPWSLLCGETAVEELLSEDSTPLAFRIDPGHGHLELLNGAGGTAAGFAERYLEYLSPGRFRLCAAPAVDELRDEEVVTEQGVPISLAGPDDTERLFRVPQQGGGVDDYLLGSRAARIGTHGSFDQLICLPLVREMELLEHQTRTARTVLRRFRGRALLCDEVGLGKTVEAGLILAELSLRGLAPSVLVLTPPSLVEQWQGEMRRKFSLDFTSYDDPTFREQGPDAWAHFDRIIVSTHTAKREPHRSAILKRRWDLVIIDEAHHLRNRTTQLWKFASELQKQYILLLTATPVQNNLEELFNLVTLLEPGLLSTSKQFQRRFVDRKDKLTPRNVEELHDLLAEVMVRNRRSTVGLQFTRRWASTLGVQPAPEERALYRDVTAFVKQHLREPPARKGKPATARAAESTDVSGAGKVSRMALIALQMALGSSSRAAASTLKNMTENSRLNVTQRARFRELAARAEALPRGAKVERLLELLAEFPDKMVIFTQFRATQALLAEELQRAGHSLAVFHGGLSRMEKEAAIQAFRGPARVLLCTEAGSEGRNLQFAHAICNFDLPWNPMKIEQRIGRLSRIGQTHDVQVYNLVATGTVEASVLHLLDAKLSMFELVVGEIDMILGNLDEDLEFQDLVADMLAQSADEDEFARHMEELGTRLLSAKQAYLEQRAHDDRLFGSRFSPDE